MSLCVRACHLNVTSVLELSDSGSTPVCVYMRDEVCSGLLTLPFSGDESEFYDNTAACPHVRVCGCAGEWRRRTKEGLFEVSRSYRRKCHCQVGC